MSSSLAREPDVQESHDKPPSSPHVCMLTSSAPLHEGDSYSAFILDLAQHLQDRGYRLTVLTPHVVGSETREIVRDVAITRYRYLPDPTSETLGLGGGILPGLRSRKFDLMKVPFLLWGQLRALNDLHSSDPIQLLHSHWLIPQSVIGGGFAEDTGIPHIATAHGSDVLGLDLPGRDAALRYATRRSLLVTVNSTSMFDALTDVVASEDVQIVSMGARPTPPGAVQGNLQRRRAWNSERNRPVVGFVGRLIEEKGVNDFIRIIANLHDRGFPVTAALIGSGSKQHVAQQLARNLEIQEAVHFVGAVDPSRVAHYMSVMDVLVVPSHYEAQGLVAAEAMLLGVPVVASRTGGLQDMITHEESGLLAECGDVDAMAEGVVRLFRDHALRERLTHRARLIASRRYTLDAAADRFAAIYRRTLGQ